MHLTIELKDEVGRPHGTESIILREKVSFHACGRRKT